MATVRVATYNVHRAIGTDGRSDPERILSVLRVSDADVCARLEVEAHGSGADMLAWLGSELRFHSIPGTTLKRHDGHFGNGVLSRCPVRARRLTDLTWRGREPRGAIAIDVDCASRELRVVATHLGLRPAERRDQVQRVARQLQGARGRQFPSFAPFLALDRVWAHPRAMLGNLAVHRTPLARKASDHLPLVATLRL